MNDQSPNHDSPTELRQRQLGRAAQREDETPATTDAPAATNGQKTEADLVNEHGKGQKTYGRTPDGTGKCPESHYSLSSELTAIV